MNAVRANPIDLPYRFSELSFGLFYRRTNREAADPSIVAFKDHYYLFASMSGGFWHSADLVDWAFVETPQLPVYDYAPDAREIDGKLVVCASKTRGVCWFFRTSDPLSGDWEQIGGTFPFFDPSLFQDDDGRIYLFEGCSGSRPITGIELDRETFARIGEAVPIVKADPATRGWERLGDDYDPSRREMPKIIQTLDPNPYVEGAWITKHAGTYYLQYAAPATQNNTYGDGYYTSSSPLGPYVYSPHSPFSLKPGGFMNAAGHGSTMRDRFGNWWHIASMRISVNHMFERRLGLWPAGFDDDGVLFTNQEFGDYPMTIPDGKADPWTLSAKAMLLSYNASVTASSSDPSHGVDLAVNEDARTWWVAGTDRPGEWVSVKLPAGSTVSHIQINLAEHEVRAPRRPKNEVTRTMVWNRHINMKEPAAEILVEASEDGQRWERIVDTRGSAVSRSHVFIELDSPRQLRFVRVTGFAMPYGSRFAVSGIRVFGRGSGQSPRVVTPEARRSSPLDADLRWHAAEGAQGYNVRYGLAKNKLYKSWLLYGKTSLTLGSLNAGYEYWVAVDSFNENGITRGEPVLIPAAASRREVAA